MNKQFARCGDFFIKKHVKKKDFEKDPFRHRAGSHDRSSFRARIETCQALPFLIVQQQINRI